MVIEKKRPFFCQPNYMECECDAHEMGKNVVFFVVFLEKVK